MSMNKVLLLGNLGQDPDLKKTPAGTSVCYFNVATTEHWQDKNNTKQEKTEWHKVIVWGKLGEHCKQYLSKGGKVLIEGYLQTRSWEDKFGEKRYTTEVIAKEVQFIGGSKVSDNLTPENEGILGKFLDAKNKRYNKEKETFTTEDIPF